MAEGRRQRAAGIAEIAVIARHRRDRKSKPEQGGHPYEISFRTLRVAQGRLWNTKDVLDERSAPIVSFIFQDEKIFRPGGVERKVGDCVPGGGKDWIVQFHFQILSVFSKHYLVARTA